MTSTTRKCIHFAAAMTLLLGLAVLSKAAPINPAVANTCSVTSPGQMVWDSMNSVMWIASANQIVGLNASCAVLGTVSLPGAGQIKSIDYDPLKGNVYAVSATAQAMYEFHGADAIGATATVNTKALDATPVYVALDWGLNRDAWVLMSSGIVETFEMHSPFPQAAVIPSPDDAPITGLAFGNSPNEVMLVITTGPRAPSGSIYSILRAYALNTGSFTSITNLNTQSLAYAAQSAYSNYLGWFFIPGTSVQMNTWQNTPGGLFVLATYFVVDGATSADGDPVISTSVSINPADLVMVEVTQYTGTNQVVFTHGNNPNYLGTGHAVPGLGVSGAYFSAFGGGFAWVSAAPMNTVTIISY